MSGFVSTVRAVPDILIHVCCQAATMERRSMPPSGYITHTVSAPSLHGKTVGFPRRVTGVRVSITCWFLLLLAATRLFPALNNYQTLSRHYSPGTTGWLEVDEHVEALHRVLPPVEPLIPSIELQFRLFRFATGRLHCEGKAAHSKQETFC